MSTATPLLATKLYIPRIRPSLVSRPRLTAQLAEGRTRTLTLVSAPPGFGKTTLISEWIDDLRSQIGDFRSEKGETPSTQSPGGNPTLVSANPKPEIIYLTESLTEREMEVLRLLQSGLSDRQIAGELIISIGTVKRHLNNIYSKFQVHSRTAALMRAKEIGLL